MNNVIPLHTNVFSSLQIYDICYEDHNNDDVSDDGIITCMSSKNKRNHHGVDRKSRTKRNTKSNLRKRTDNNHCFLPNTTDCQPNKFDSCSSKTSQGSYSNTLN